jgi:transcriptional regulator with XRE-family HTH domain
MYEDDKGPFSRALQTAIDEKGMIQEVLAQKIGKSHNTVALMVNGKRYTTIPTIIKICKVLDIKPNRLFSPYLDKEDEYMEEDDYHKIINMLDDLEDNEITILYRLIDIIKGRRG